MKPAASQGLPRERRLRRSGEFGRLRREGRRLVVGCLIMNWQPAPEGAGSRLGVVTSRALGSAVVRSRGRRLMREVWRRHQNALRQPVNMVLVARPSLAAKSFGQVEADFLQALRLARLLKDL
ncbi:ribonuclease P protein component [Fontisphaera persica]|uniref:ribonuclease P protein component n=1 Tax=Fontisphaera persica TaxID=2974023 RepID=UPI0024C0C2ED|nr:ribonuclease P protein component [Fontisphaera persica]WCJ59421.1 ribonuclease P protein component [Fontisphaera persica]